MSDNNGLMSLQEANRKLGLGKGSHALHVLEEQGKVKLIRKEGAAGRTYTFIAPEQLKTAFTLLERPETPEGGDPLLTALLQIQDGIKALRAAIQEHDKQVRRATIADLADNLKEGLR